MGKNRKLKQLRKLATQLPLVQERKVIIDFVKGNNIETAFKSDNERKAIDPQKTYRRKRVVDMPINHYKKMKQNYKKAGMAGAAIYAKSVVQYAKQKKENK